MVSSGVEANFDGLAGPTHNYSGLSPGNVASSVHAQSLSNPREAALQGLAKMGLLHGLGLVQGIFPPQDRPDLGFLRSHGFSGTDAEVIERASAKRPDLLAVSGSASSLWSANAATVSPSSDTADGKVHFTPANLLSNLHRSIETAATAACLKKIFADPKYFVHHPPCPSTPEFADEGAANHTRFCNQYGEKGIHLFVYGKTAQGQGRQSPKRFPARQSLEAFQMIAKNHALNAQAILFVQQNPQVIDQGVFHNDVIAVGNRQVFLFHEKAFVNTQETLTQLQNLFQGKMRQIAVSETDLTVNDAVSSYFFNSQLISKDDQTMILVAPIESRDNARVKGFIDHLLAQALPIREVHYCDLRQSMKNGGGPACLRLRVVLNDVELAAVNPDCLIDDRRLKILTAWVKKHYRDRLHPQDLADPNLMRESRTALDELTQILNLGNLYAFQQ